jgi:hypothetical protein
VGKDTSVKGNTALLDIALNPGLFIISCNLIVGPSVAVLKTMYIGGYNFSEE